MSRFHLVVSAALVAAAIAVPAPVDANAGFDADALRRTLYARVDAARAATPPSHVQPAGPGGPSTRVVMVETLRMPFVDLDGDRAVDILFYEVTAVPYDTGDARVVLRSGRTGKLLWDITVPDMPAARPEFVVYDGPGRIGLLLVTPANILSLTPTLRIRLLQADGVIAWDRSWTGFSSTRGDYVLLPTFAGVLQASGRRSDDILITMKTGTWNRGGVVTPPPASRPVYSQISQTRLLRLSVDDGTSNVIRDLDPRILTIEPHLVAASDLTGDGLGDIVMRDLDDAGTPRLSALSGLDGRELWSTTEAPEPWWIAVSPSPLGNAIGDATPDVLLRMFSGDNKHAVVVLDGATGATGLVREEADTQPLAMATPGDLNGDRRADVVVGVHFVTGKRSGMSSTAYTGSGRRLWERDTAGSGSPGAYFGMFVIDDADRDRVSDLVMSVTVGRSVLVRTTSGRTGALLAREPLRPLGGAVDGSGPDLGVVSVAKDSLILDVRDGTRGRQVWKTRLRPGATPVGGGMVAAKLDGSDQCADVLLFALLKHRDGLGVWVFALDGRTGALRWSVTPAGELYRGARATRIAGAPGRC